MAELIEDPIHIIVPVDYSEPSKHASAYALQLAMRLKATLEFLHVYYTPSLDLLEISNTSFSQNQIDAEALEDIEASESRLIEGFINDLFQGNRPEINVKSTVIPGIPEDEILAYTEENKPDLCIMGTRGKNMQKVAIFGSVTVSVLDRIKVPLLIIPENFNPIIPGEMKHLLYVTTFDKADFESIDRLMKLISPFQNVRIDCMHIESGPTSTWDEIKLSGLCDYIKNKYNRQEVHCRGAREKDLLPVIDSFTKEHQVNAIAMTTRRINLIKKLFVADIPKKLLYHSTVPLLIFHS